jgi:hypothetical protein
MREERPPVRRPHSPSNQVGLCYLEPFLSLRGFPRTSSRGLRQLLRPSSFRKSQLLLPIKRYPSIVRAAHQRRARDLRHWGRKRVSSRLRINLCQVIIIGEVSFSISHPLHPTTKTRGLRHYSKYNGEGRVREDCHRSVRQKVLSSVLLMFSYVRTILSRNWSWSGYLRSCDVGQLLLPTERKLCDMP